MKTICILTSVHNPDDNRVYYKEVQSISRFHFNVIYMAPGQKERTDGNITYVNVIKPDRKLKRMLGFYRIYKQAKAFHCDIYHFQDAELILVGLLLKYFARAKVIYDVHEDYPSQMLSKHYLKSFLRKPLYNLMKVLEFWADKKFDAIVVADNFVYKHFKNPNTVILYNYPDINAMEQSMDGHISWDDKLYDIIFPGSMARFTAEMMLQIVKVAKDRGVNLKCALISPFHFEGGIEWVESRIYELGLDIKNFLLKKRIPTYEVPKYIQKARIGLIPLPDTEKMRANIPTKLFEYMYSGIPVITGNLPPSAQFMENENFGFLVDPNSFEEYTDRIIELLHNQKKAEQMGDNGRQLTIEKYNWGTEEIKLIELYGRILLKER